MFLCLLILTFFGCDFKGQTGKRSSKVGVNFSTVPFAYLSGSSKYVLKQGGISVALERQHLGLVIYMEVR